MFLRKIIPVIAFFILLDKTAAQSVKQGFVPPSPTAASLGVYGDVNVSHYTGIPDIKIPIYVIKLGDFQFPIDLSYHSGGLKVLDEATSVGLNWSINNSGVITRAIKALDDFSANGYFKIHSDDRTVGSGKDLEPDIFYYNFAGKIGKFIIDHSSDKPYEIKLLKRDDNIKFELDLNGNWVVTTDDGIEFKFEKKENQRQNISISTLGNYVFDYTTGWYLSSINVKGQNIKFEYNLHSPKVIRKFTQKTAKVLMSLVPNPACAPHLWGQLNSRSDNLIINETTSITDEVLLDSIMFPNGQISFKYSDRVDLNNEDLSFRSQKLDSILVKYGKKRLKKFHLKSDYFSSNSQSASHISKRLKLNSIEEVSPSDTLSYEFKYFENSPIPDKVEAYDEPYGFYSQDLKSGIIQEIIYPTKGSVRFEFEPHDYSERPFATAQPSSNKLGLRVKSIKYTNSLDQVINTKVFEYKKLNTDNDLVSSGKLLSGSIRYYSDLVPVPYTCDGAVGGTSIAKYQISSSTNVVPLGESANGSAVGYDEVTIYENGEGQNGKSVYFYINNMDVYPSVFIPGYPGRYDNSNGTLKRINYYSKASSSYKLIKSEVYSYDISTLTPIEGAKLGGSGTGRYYYYIAPVEIKKTEEVTTHYFGSNVDEATKFVYNNSYFKVSEIEKRNSEGKVASTKFTYPFDMLTNDSDGVYQRMVKANSISAIVEEVQLTDNKQVFLRKKNYFEPSLNVFVPETILVSHSENGALESKQKLTYDEIGNITGITENAYTTSYQWGYNNQYPIAEVKNGLASEVYIENFEESSVAAEGLAHTGKKFRTGPFVLNWKRPNARNYLISYWYRDLGSWKYKSEHPFTNNSYEFKEGDAYDDIRIYPKDAEVTTYTYKPLLGMTSSTDARGQTTYYEYDGFQRLHQVLNHNKEVIKRIRYNYAGQGIDCNPSVTFQNIAKSQDFRKSTCGGNYEGSLVTYTVPAGKHSSTISQADADGKALAEINANGQANANQKGSCTLCSGADKKMINGVCVTGWKTYTNSVAAPGGGYKCFYIMRWPDGSQLNGSEMSSKPCVNEVPEYPELPELPIER